MIQAGGDFPALAVKGVAGKAAQAPGQVRAGDFPGPERDEGGDQDQAQPGQRQRQFFKASIHTGVIFSRARLPRRAAPAQARPRVTSPGTLLP